MTTLWLKSFTLVLFKQMGSPKQKGSPVNPWGSQNTSQKAYLTQPHTAPLTVLYTGNKFLYLLPAIKNRMQPKASTGVEDRVEDKSL